MGFGSDSDFYRSYFPGVYYHNKIRIKELCDSLGNLLVKNGNGHAVIYNDDFKKIVIQGDLKNYKREADWTGPIGDTGKFVCTYHKMISNPAQAILTLVDGILLSKSM